MKKTDLQDTGLRNDNPLSNSSDCSPRPMPADILAAVINSADVGLYASDYYTGEILFANHIIAQYANCTIDELIGKKCWTLICSDRTERCSFCPYQKLIDENGNILEKYTWELYVPPLDKWLRAINQAVRWIDGRLVQIVTFYDITETKNMQNQLENLAYIDQRLRLKNGLRLERDVQEAEDKPSIIVLDILSLQKINEAYGRDIGDKLLEDVWKWIISQNIPNSELYRIGGDEFCFTIGQISSEDLQALTKQVSDRFSEPWLFDTGTTRLRIFCDASIAAILGDYVQGSGSLLNLIERTLKVAKNNGKITIYDEALDRDFKKYLQLEMNLKKCVRENMRGFEVYYQPIADPITGTWCGLEALCRWYCPEVGPVSPLTFIPEAERLNLIGTIGLWVLKTSVAQCKEWRLDKLTGFMLDVNLSAAQFSDELLMLKIMKVLDDYEYPPEKLSIEITESTQFTFTDSSLNTIEYLRSKNVQVALDDFGTGYSSFNNLKSLPINILKIERVFITNIEHDSYQQYLFHVMAELAHAVNMKLIAEGVENMEQLDILLKNGADLLQGYLFSKPLPPRELETQLYRFYDVDESFSIVRSRKIDIKKLKDAENNYILTPNLYKVLNQCMHILFYSTDMNEAINQVLKTVGIHMNVSRAYVFLREEGNIYTEANEWCADGIASQKEFLARLPIAKEWLDALKNDGIVLSTDISALPTYLYEMFKSADIKAIAALPLWDGNTLFGFVGLDDCRYFRDWRPEEILMLCNLCVVIASTLHKRSLQDEVTRRSDIMNYVLNSMYMPIYVSEIDTGEILFANRSMKNIFGVDLVGQTCWQALQRKSERCSFCKIELLKTMPDGTEYEWEYYNPIVKRHFRIFDTLIPWVDNRRVHLKYSIDITVLKEREALSLEAACTKE